MKPIHMLYLKVFLFMGIGIALLMMLIDYAFNDLDGALEYIIKGIIFGLLMSGFGVSGHTYALRGLGIETFTREVLGVRHQKEIQSSITPNELLSRIKENRVLKSAKIRDTHNGWKIRTGISWKGWGEVIDIQYSLFKNDLYEYRISSKPLLPTTMFDNGVNYNHILRFEKMLHSFS